jgi:hypothetical protein
VASLQGTLDSRGVRVQLRVPRELVPPRADEPTVAKALGLLLDAVSALSPKAAVALRCEKKPVLLRGRDGSEIKRDFLMLALAHAAVVPPELQQQVVQGSAAGPLGEMCRLIRQSGGFVRFAPLPGSGLESRLFFPA